jgi:hypothetical protein
MSKQPPPKSGANKVASEELHELRQITNRLPTKEQTLALVAAANAVQTGHAHRTATGPRAALTRAATPTMTAASLIAALIAIWVGVAAIHTARDIANTQDAETIATPIAGEFITTPGPPPAVFLRLYNTGRVDAEVVTVTFPGSTPTFYTAASCGNLTFNQHGPVTIGEPFDLPPGRSTLVDIPIPLGHAFGNFNVQAHLADGRTITMQPNTTESAAFAAYAPDMARIYKHCAH